jgi:hypothetical protein
VNCFLRWEPGEGACWERACSDSDRVHQRVGGRGRCAAGLGVARDRTGRIVGRGRRIAGAA